MPYKNITTNEIKSVNELAEIYHCTAALISIWKRNGKLSALGWIRYYRPVRCIETNEIYSSRTELCERLGISKSNLATHLKYGYPLTLKGKKYEEI